MEEAIENIRSQTAISEKILAAAEAGRIDIEVVKQLIPVKPYIWQAKLVGNRVTYTDVRK